MFAYLLLQLVVTVPPVAPELLNVSSRQTQYDTSVDMYSFGVIVQALWAQVCTAYNALVI
jgi:hypothetical protein